MAPSNASQEMIPLSIVKDVANDSDRQRVLIHTQALAQSKIPAGEGLILKFKDAQQPQKPLAVGIAWPSFSLPQNSLQLPSLLNSSSTIKDLPSDSQFTISKLPASQTQHLQKITVKLLSVKSNASTSSSSSDEECLHDLNQSQRDLISLCLKEALISLEFVLPNQDLELEFQGRTYRFELGTSWESSTTNSKELFNSEEHLSNPNRNLSLTLSISRSTKIILKKGSKDAGLIDSKGKTSGDATPAQSGREPDISTDEAVEKIELEGENGKQDEEAWAYASLAGLEKQVEEVRKLVEMPLKRPELFQRYGLQPPRGLLLFGPPGTGKTSLARAAALAAGCSVFVINGPELSSSYHGETERSLRSIFSKARRNSPAVVLIDEIDALAPRRDAGGGGGGDAGGVGEGNEGAGEVEKRVTTTLLTLLDGVDLDEDGKDGNDQDEEKWDEDFDDEDETGFRKKDAGKEKRKPRIVVIAATNRPNALDPALRRPGRLDREIEIGIPTPTSRLSILKLLLRKVPHSLTDQDIDSLASVTHGYVGADLGALVREAGMKAVGRTIEKEKISNKDTLVSQLNNISLDSSSSEKTQAEDLVSLEDFHSVLPFIRPSSMREVFLTLPPVKWSDIGCSSTSTSNLSKFTNGSDLTRNKSIPEQVQELIEWPLKHRSSFLRLGITPPRGVLLYGPPGCSKTLIARAIATESGLNFMAVKGGELFSKYVGDSERAVREVFRKARAASPSIIFFDELDALTSTRGSGSGDSDSLSDRVIASLLNEMDGIETLSQVIVVAATNRPGIIVTLDLQFDPALLRPGRLDRLIYVPPPDQSAREQILKIRTSKMACSNQVDLKEISELLEGCSGAEVVSVCQEAGMIAMNQNLNCQQIDREHFVKAASSVRRRITREMILGYERWRDGVGV